MNIPFFDSQSFEGLGSEIFLKILSTLFILLGAWIGKKLIYKTILHKIKSPQTAFIVRRAVNIVVAVTLLVAITQTWIGSLSQIGTILGLLTAGVAIVLKDLLVNVTGWIIINTNKPYSVGDRIQIDDTAGDIIDITPLYTTILEIGNWIAADQSTGRIIHIPNSTIFSKKIANYTKAFDYIWHEIGVLINFESDWKKAKNILLDIAVHRRSQILADAKKQLTRASKNYLLFAENIEPVVFTSVKDSGVLLTIRYLCKVRNRRGSENELWEEILAEFDKHSDIDFAYPTQRFYMPPAGDIQRFDH